LDPEWKVDKTSCGKMVSSFCSCELHCLAGEGFDCNFSALPSLLNCVAVPER
jgi:hypothetical protein